MDLQITYKSNLQTEANLALTLDDKIKNRKKDNRCLTINDMQKLLENNEIKPHQITKMEIPEGIKELGPRVFKERFTKLKEVILAKTTRIIRSEAFSNLESLVSVSYRKNPLVSMRDTTNKAKILNGAYRGCKKLIRLEIANGVREIGQTVLSGTPIGNNKQIYLPYSVTNFNPSIAQQNIFTHKVIIPDGTEEITAGFFQNSRIHTIALPTTLKKISESAFQNCQWLRSITLGNQIEEIGNNAFKGHHKNFTLEVPQDLYDKIIPCYKYLGIRNLKNIKILERPSNEAQDTATCTTSELSEASIFTTEDSLKENAVNGTDQKAQGGGGKAQNAKYKSRLSEASIFTNKASLKENAVNGTDQKAQGGGGKAQNAKYKNSSPDITVNTGITHKKP